MGLLPDQLPGYLPVADERGARSARMGRAVPADRDATTTPCFGGVHALYCHGGRSGAAAQHQSDWRVWKRSISSSCRISVLTETAKRATVVLPAVAYTEKDGTFTNTERAVQVVRAR